MANKIDSAFAVWNKAVTLNHNNSMNYRVIANYEIQNRAFENALKLLKEGKERANDPTYFSFDIANIYSIMMDYKSAAKEYCEILLNDSKRFSIVQRQILKLLNSHNAAKEITSTIEKCSEEHDEISIKKLLVNIYKHTGNFDRAFDLVRELDKSTNQNGKFLLKFAKDNLHSGNFAIAEKAYRVLLNEYSGENFSLDVKEGLAESILKNIDKGKNSSSLESSFSLPEKIVSPKTTEAVELLTQILDEAKSPTQKLRTEYELAEVYNNYILNFRKADSLFADIISTGQRSSYYFPSLIYLGKSAIRNGDLKSAENYFAKVIKNKRSGKEKNVEAKYYLGKIEYYEGKFTKALQTLNEAAYANNQDFANDAIDLKMLISVFKKDSVNLALFAQGNLLIAENKPEEAIKVLSKIAENKNAFMLNDLAALRVAEIEFARKKYEKSEKILERLNKENKPEINPDKTAFLLGKIYYKTGKLNESLKVFNNFLEKYPNSLYLSVIRENIKLIKEEIDGRN
jgi:tetratricopeptide (TPR) repeat protein